MFNAFKLLYHLWRVNKWEAFVLSEFIGIFCWFLYVELHSLFPNFHFTIVGLLVEGVAELFTFALEKKFALPTLVAAYTKTNNPEIKAAAGNIVEHITAGHIINNLYGNLTLFKLRPTHFPRSRKDIGTSFDFVRHKGDFLPEKSGQDLSKALKDFQIKDFELIQKSIKKSWRTVTYGDISILLQQLSYIISNIQMGYKGVNKKKKLSNYLCRKKNVNTKRLFIYPYWNDDLPSSELSNYKGFIKDLKNINISPDEMRELVTTSGMPSVNFDKLDSILDSQYSAIIYKDKIRRALVDAIHLVWLIKIHEEFKIDYKILYKHETVDNNQIDLVGSALFREEKIDNDYLWKDEGSALLDDSVIVRFDDQMENSGFIHYQFYFDSAGVSKYKTAFESIWSSGLPRTYSLEETIDYFFSNTTAASLKNISSATWINLINRELM